MKRQTLDFCSIANLYEKLLAMRNTFLMSFICLICLPFISQAQQEETLFKKVRYVGGFGGPIVEYNWFDGEGSLGVGGGGGVILDNFFIGGYGVGLTDPNIDFDNQDDLTSLDLGHGGLWLGYTLKSYKVAHLYSSVRLGYGGVDIEIGEDDFFESDNVGVITPEIGVEVNLTSFMRLAVTGGYRFIEGFDADDPRISLTESDLEGAFMGFTLRFGSFGW